MSPLPSGVCNAIINPTSPPPSPPLKAQQDSDDQTEKMNDQSQPQGEAVAAVHDNDDDNSAYFNSLPPGYRFCPQDDELIEHYLQKKVLNQPLPINRIREVELYKHNPHDLAERYRSYGDNEWYFFTPRDRKYRNGNRPSRTAGAGYWKATGADRKIERNRKEIGFRKALVFYVGKAPKGDKTNWIMHEFRVLENTTTSRGPNDMKLDDWVLCKIYKKPDKSSRDQIQDKSSREEIQVQVEDVVDTLINGNDDHSDAANEDFGPANTDLNHSNSSRMVYPNHSNSSRMVYNYNDRMDYCMESIQSLPYNLHPLPSESYHTSTGNYPYNISFPISSVKQPTHFTETFPATGYAYEDYLDFKQENSNMLLPQYDDFSNQYHLDSFNFQLPANEILPNTTVVSPIIHDKFKRQKSSGNPC